MISREEFIESFVNEIQRHLDCTIEEAERAFYGLEELCDPFGTEGYDWSLEAAKEWAWEYIQDYGELEQ